MTEDLSVDVETKSVVDLRKTNVDIYFDDPSTDLWVLAYAFGDEEPELWWPGQPCPPRIIAHVKKGGLIRAWNCSFERKAWSKLLGPKYGWPVPDLRQYRCTMVRAYAQALPGKLEHAAIALGIREQKDMVGSRLMMKMAKPRSPRKKEPPGLYWHDKPEEIARLGEYVKQDVRTERDAGKRLLHLSEFEQEVYFLDQRINDRGVYVDKQLCDAANKIVLVTMKKLDAEMRKVTDGEVRGVSNVSELIAFVRKQGIETNSVAKDEIVNLLIRDDLPPDVYRALELRQEGAKTSTAKINAMLTRRQADGRMRGNLQYHAAGTGRFGGRGAQLQNQPRPSIKASAIGPIIEDVLTGDADLVELLHGPPMSVVSDCIRSMIAAEPDMSNILRDVDFSAIEARITAWLAGEEKKIEAFRAADEKRGEDPYCLVAAGIYNEKIAKSDPRRQTGKVGELALGFGGGAGALAKMAKNYSLDIGATFDPVWSVATPTNKEKVANAWEDRGKQSGMAKKEWFAAEAIKLAWRDNSPKTVELWKAIEDAAIEAALHPGRVVNAGKHLKYRRSGSWLFCQLPSKRVITYPYPRVEWALTPWGSERPKLIYKGVDSFSKKWCDQDFYGGLGTENAVQGTARDIMVEAMFRVERAGYRIILTIHDEILSCNRVDEGSLEEFERLAAIPPSWASDLPIAVEGWEGKRYQK